MKKTIGLLVMAMIVKSSLFAQTLKDAIKLTSNEQYESGDAAFKKLLDSQPNNGEIYFYYGENYFLNDKTQQANAMYQKGTELNATNPFCYVGVGKVLWYMGKQAEAKTMFYKATTLAAGKNATVLMKIAEVYIDADTKNIADALILLDQAAKLEPQNPGVYILMGDAYLEQNDATKAVNNFEKAEQLDKKSTIAIQHQGQVWNRARNFELAIKTYKRALMVDSTFAPAFRELGDIYFRANQFKNASINYKKYLFLNNDCSARRKYAQSAYVAKQYQESLDAVNMALQCDSNYVLNYRIKAFDQFELGDFPNGLATSDKFFKKADAGFKFIFEDYDYHAKLLSKNGKDSLAILDYKRLLEFQPDKIEVYGDIANANMKMKKWAEAIAAYKMKIEKGKPNANDYFGIGRAYYYSKDFINSDSSFVKLVISQPDLPLGYLWRAKSNVQLDPKNEKWAAKPFYETFISKVKPEEAEKNKKDLIDAYNYVAAYYASLKDKPNVKIYIQKILDLDPANAPAKKIMDGLN